MPGDKDSTPSPSEDKNPPSSKAKPKSLWEQHKAKVIGGVFLAIGLTLYNNTGSFLKWAAKTWFSEQVVGLEEIKDLTKTAKDNAEALKNLVKIAGENKTRSEFMEKDIKSLEKKVDLQSEFIKEMLGGDG